jgi:4-carboxymuconolactone decarboxylase
MKALFAALTLISTILASAQTEKTPVMQKANSVPTAPTLEDIRAASPALAQYTQNRLLGDPWKQPDLTPRDRSIVTLSALIARNQTMQMPYYLNVALDNGVKPSETSEIITHLAFYSGWENAISAVVIAKDVFRQRGINADQLPPATVELPPLDEAAEKQRATSVEQNFGAVTTGIVQYTTECSFANSGYVPALRLEIGVW